ncbi:MAG: hypothetical protein IKJ37_05585 [Kiritimatiellae bacterium]|nr:hypothetical protein [Kiritimatiellia bacterium]
MFDNPKKELEWLQAQLLAAESDDEEDEVLDEPEEDIYDDFSEDDPFDEELDGLLNGTYRNFDAADRDVSCRAAGFDADDYVMDTDRYVSAPKKKSGCLTAFALIQALLIIGFVLWALGRML